MQPTRRPYTTVRLRHLLPLLLLGATGCGTGDGGRGGDHAAGGPDHTTASIEIVDAAGRTVRLDGPAARILSLVPSATLTLHTIGASDHLVGRTDYDKEAWIRSLPSVGGGLEPNLEAVVMLRPDLVVRFEGSQDRRTPARLDELGIAHLAVRPDGIDDVLETVRMLGLATGRIDESEALVAAIRTDLTVLESRVATLPRKNVAYVLGGTPPWVAGPGTYIHELVTLVGGDNVFDDLGALYAPVSPEEVRSRRIDVVLASGIEAFDRSLAPDARVEFVDDGLEIPGPDLAASALRLAELIHGSLPPSSASSGP